MKNNKVLSIHVEKMRRERLLGRSLTSFFIGMWRNQRKYLG